LTFPHTNLKGSWCNLPKI